MTNGAQEYDITAIRQILIAAFTPEELRRFCHDRPDFRLIVRRFGSKSSLEDMVEELITYCDNYRYLPELLAELKQHNPRQYTHFIDPELSVHQPAPPPPRIFDICHPISLLLVRVPAGEFQMGSVMSRDRHAWGDEFPPHPVHVPEFHIGRYPVTNAQFQAFVWATGYLAPFHWQKGTVPPGRSNHPVVNVSWHYAVEFCNWLRTETGQPFRLPTEAEWEKAARGTDGRIYPWGDDPPTEDRCNFNSNAGDTTMTGHYSPQGDSPYGCADMAGNVLEWCQSLVRPYPYWASDGREATWADGFRVLRSGSFDSSEGRVRCAYRGRWNPNHWSKYFGFRVVVAPGTSGL
jgi:formylglycine-generating enzyme required for sulfatase activity